LELNIIYDGRFSLFLVVAFVVMISPGPAVLLAITNGVLHGIKSSCFAIAGNMSGFLILSTVSVLGLGVIISRWQWLFDVIKWGGGLYLIYLGYRMWNTRKERVGVRDEIEKVISLSPLQMYRRGFVVTLSNPKAIVFVTALFPQFISPEQPLFSQYLILAGGMIFIQGVVLAGYAFLASRARALLNRSGNLNKGYKTSGVVFALFGVSLFFAEN
jgi:threonine/homoserine/homoserine lactone efflux protein